MSFSPKISISPSVGLTKLVISFMIVVFPAPFGPRNPYISPFLMFILTFETTFLSLNVFVKFVVFNIYFNALTPFITLSLSLF
ncbi:hypothetical protein D3C76_1078900 [compost metagenome]